MKKPAIELRPVSWLKPYDKNAKNHPPEQIRRLVESIKRFGWKGNPIITDPEGVIIAGHGRRLAAIELGLPNVPVVIETEMTVEQARAFRLADNRAAESTIDGDLFAAELEDLGEISLELLEGIFDVKEIDFFTANLGEINEDALVTDLDAEVRKQADETAESIAKTDERQVKLDKALGFKTVRGADERTLAMFMAVIEDKTGLTGAEALVAHAESVLSNP